MENYFGLSASEENHFYAGAHQKFEAVAIPYIEPFNLLSAVGVNNPSVG